MKFFSRKAQSAMEYLMTYGWAILIILIAVGALFYLGVFSPSTPSTCQISAPFNCQDIKFLANPTGGGALTLVIGVAGVSYANITDVSIGTDDCTTIVNGDLITQGGLSTPVQVTCTETSWDHTAGTKISGTFTSEYTLQGSDLIHTTEGQFSGTAE